MKIEVIAAQVAAEYQMTFEGVYLDFAKEVARRVGLNELRACKDICDQVGKKWNDFDDVTAGEIKRRINARSNLNSATRP